LIHGGVLEQKIDSVVPIVHAMQVAELNPDDEAIWMLEGLFHFYFYGTITLSSCLFDV
jgi:hypothetical protein